MFDEPVVNWTTNDSDEGSASNALATDAASNYLEIKMRVSAQSPIASATCQASQ